jgi:ABC-2 type transport system ATP-binding protein
VDAAISLQDVTKSFGTTRAVEDLSLSVPHGGLYGFIGPNGAGKTTTLRIIMSILLPDRGRVSVLGKSSALEAKDRVGYLPEERGVYRKMRVGAFLRYMGQLKGVSASILPSRVRIRLERMGLGDLEEKRCEELSKGTLQKVQFLGAVIQDPDLLILDEPFSGLDPVSTLQLRGLIQSEHKRGATVVLSTHVMAHAEELCEHVVMIHQGRKVLDDPVATIRGRYDPRTIRLQPLRADADGGVLRGLNGVDEVKRIEGGFEVVLAGSADTAAAMSHIAAALPSSRIELARPTLEDVFIGIVAGKLPGAVR